MFHNDFFITIQVVAHNAPGRHPKFERHESIKTREYSIFPFTFKEKCKTQSRLVSNSLNLNELSAFSCSISANGGCGLDRPHLAQYGVWDF